MKYLLSPLFVERTRWCPEYCTWRNISWSRPISTQPTKHSHVFTLYLQQRLYMTTHLLVKLDESSLILNKFCASGHVVNDANVSGQLEVCLC